MELGRPASRLLLRWAKDGGVLDQGYNSGGGEKQLNFSYSWKVKPTGLANKLDFKCEIKRQVMDDFNILRMELSLT